MKVPSGFLYRRLAKLIPCVLPNIGNGTLPLGGKWEVASARDVFLSAHHWRLFDHISEPPRLVLDLGAHCGHFIVLMHLLAEERFGFDHAHYLAVEPMAEMQPIIRRTLDSAGLAAATQIVQALVGLNHGSDRLFSGAHTRMDSSVFRADSSVEPRGQTVDYVDLDRLIGDNQVIDILKVDIEGSEYAFVRQYPELLKRTRLIALELHPISGECADELVTSLINLGFVCCSEPIQKADGCRLMLMRNDQCAGTQQGH